MFQSQVDGSGNKAWTENQAADLNFHPRLTPRISVHDDAARISSGFEKGSNTEGKRVRPCFGEDSDGDSSEEAKGEQGGEKGVGP